MTWIFSTSRNVKPYAAIRAHRILTEAPIVIAFIMSTLLATVAWLAYGAWDQSELLLGSALLLTSSAALWLLLLAFASIYYPSLVPGTKLPKLVRSNKPTRNLAWAADWQLLQALGPAATISTPDSLRAGLLGVLTAPAAKTMLKRLELKTAEVETLMTEVVLPLLTWESFSEQMYHVASTFKAGVLMPEYALAALLLNSSAKSWLRQRDLQEHDIIFVTWWLTTLRVSRQRSARWWEREQLLKFSGIGLSWTSGFTPLVDRLSHFPVGNLWDQVIFGHEQQVEQLITTLARQRQSNVAIVGQAGAGRLGVVLEMVRRVRSNTAHPALAGQRVVYLHIGEILAQANSDATQLAIIGRVLKEMERAGNIIAVLDGLGSLLGGSRRGQDLSDIILPFFASLSVRVVVMISSDDYHSRLENNQELNHFFEVINIAGCTANQALQVLAFSAPTIEQTAGVQLPYKTLRAITEGTDAVLPQIPFPERAFDVLEEALVVAQGQSLSALEPHHITAIISQKTGIPVGAIKAQEQSRLLNLEALLHEQVVNQRHAIAAIAHAMIRARTGVRTLARPIGTFLFLGPTGVGKTQTAKALAQAYFGNDNFLTRLDMSEFQNADSVDILLGGSDGTSGRLTTLITDRPYTVLLLDEFEKAHAQIHQLFLQVFDEGRLTDRRGQLVSFKHAVIIATSNAGAEFIRTAVKAGPLPTGFDAQLREHVLQQGIFRPELINRFDGVITFTSLTPEHLEQVARLMLGQLNKRLDQEHGITVAITQELLAYLLTIGSSPEFGARPMARAIQDTVEYAIAQQILRGTVTPGQEIVLSPLQLQQQVVLDQG